MSELKAFRIIQGDTGGYGAPSYKCDTDGNCIDEWSDICEVYDKSEADHCISKLIADQQLELDEWYCKVQHHKYKRCLAMAKYCDMGLTCYNEKLDRFSCERADFFYRWYNRWWKLAEKFKEAK